MVCSTEEGRVATQICAQLLAALGVALALNSID
jgi:hypothetical protein